MTEPPLYDSVPQALSAAYRVHDKAYCKTSAFFADLRGATIESRPKSEMHPMDWIAQAGLIVGKVQRELSGTRHVLVVEAKYIPGTTPLGRDSKDTACILLGRLMKDEFTYPEHWMNDVIRQWAGARFHHDQGWWARRLGTTEMTLWRWRNKGPREHGGVVTKLNDWLEEAHMRLYPALSGGVVA